VRKGKRIEGLKAPSGVVSGEKCPLPSRLGSLWEHPELPSAGTGAESRSETHFGRIFGS